MGRVEAKVGLINQIVSVYVYIAGLSHQSSKLRASAVTAALLNRRVKCPVYRHRRGLLGQNGDRYLRRHHIGGHRLIICYRFES